MSFSSRTYWAWLKTTLPADVIEVGGLEVRLGGLGMTVAVSEVQARMGFGKLEIYEAGGHGWEQMMTRGEQGIWSQITFFGNDTYLLAVADQTGGWRRPWRPFVEGVLVPFNEGLRRDPRVIGVRWMDPDNVNDDLHGFNSPADPALLDVYSKKWGRR
jgi:hypothetical protein